MTATASPAAPASLAPPQPPHPALDGGSAPTVTPSVASSLCLRSTLHGDERVPFTPADPASRRVTWYVCGPTVYDVAHMVSLTLGCGDGGGWGQEGTFFFFF
jgi:hypothetical protein